MTAFVRAITVGCLLLTSGVFFGKEKHRGKRLLVLLQKLGPSYIKLGQTLSVRPDIVGEDIAKELTLLQDNIPPFSTKKAVAIIEKETGKTLDHSFSHFEEQAIAAASVAQVHKAITIDGKTVAVKILRPGIVKAFYKDIKVFYMLAGWISLFKKAKRLRLKEVVFTFEKTVRRETDLRMEAASASQLAKNCARDSDVHIPLIFWPLTSQKMMTSEWVEGSHILDIEALEKLNISRREIARKLAVNFFNQVYRDGFFHADTHPGNLLIDTSGRLVMVDFGIMGRLDEATRIFVAKILHGFLVGDYDAVAKVHFDAGYVPAHQNREEFAIACRAIGEPILGLSASQVSVAKLLALLFKVTEDFEMETQPQLLLLQKTMVLVEGIGAALYPEVNLWQLAEGWIEDWAKENLSPIAEAKRQAAKMAEQLLTLPETMHKLQFIINDEYEKRLEKNT